MLNLNLIFDFYNLGNEVLNSNEGFGTLMFSPQQTCMVCSRSRKRLYHSR